MQARAKFDPNTYYEGFSCTILANSLSLSVTDMSQDIPDLIAIGYRGSNDMTYASDLYNKILLAD